MNSRLSPLDNAVPVAFASFGEANPEHIFYVIYREGNGAGFFSNVFHVLGHLMLAEKLGITPVVDMKHFPTVYNEREPINDTFNAWEYYFTQPAGFSLDDVYRSRHVAFCDGKSHWHVYYDNALAISLAQRFLRVLAPIREEVEGFYKEFFLGKTVLGVHFRGQEMKVAPDHPACPTVEQMLTRTRILLAAYPIDAIFLVTEEQAYLDAYRAAFGDMVLHTAAFRTYDVNAYRIRPYPRPLHMYDLGLDVLKDTLLLARTDYLLAGGNDGLAIGSNVSRMAQVWNAGAYRHIELIWNGVNPSATTEGFTSAVDDLCAMKALRAQAHAAEEKAERYRAEADALRASTSWRITGPVRGIRRLLG